MTTSTSLVDIRAQLKAQLENQRERIEGPTSRWISTKGKVFTLPDGQVSQGPLNLVILDWRITHAYRTGMYDAARSTPPDCWALSETVNCAPDPTKVKSPRHSTCNGCPFNEYGTATGGRGKACKETRRLAVSPVDAQVGDKPFLIDVSPTGIQGFEGLVTMLRKKGMNPMEIVTEVAFRSDASYPTLVFSPAAALTDEQLAVMFEIRSRAAAFLDRDMSMN